MKRLLSLIVLPLVSIGCGPADEGAREGPERQGAERRVQTGLVATLADPNAAPLEKSRAVDWLVRLGEPAVEPLIELVGDGGLDPAARTWGLTALWRLANHGKTANLSAQQVSALAGVLRDRELPADACIDLAVVLGQAPVGSDEAFPFLVEMLKEADPQVRTAAAEALAHRMKHLSADWKESAVSLLAGSLSEENFGVRIRAARAISVLRSTAGPGARIEDEVVARIVPVVVDGMRSGDADLQEESIAICSEMASVAERCAPAFAELLGDESIPADSLQSVCFVLADLGPRAAPAIPALARVVADPAKGAFLRTEAIRTLGNILGRQLRGKPLFGVTQYCPRTRRQPKPEEQAAVRAIAQALDVSETRDVAIDALAQIGPGAEAAVPALLRLVNRLRKEWSETKESLAERFALYKAWVEPKKLAVVYPMLLDTAETRVDQTRRVSAINSVVEVFGHIGAAHPEVVALLARILNDGRAGGPDNDQTRTKAAWALGRLGPGAEQAIPALIQGLLDPDSSVRHAAAWATTQLPPPTVVPELVKMLNASRGRNETDELIQFLDVLRVFGRDADAAVVHIAPLLNDPRDSIREAAARALRDMDSTLGDPAELDSSETGSNSALDEMRTLVSKVRDPCVNGADQSAAALALTRFGGRAVAPLADAAGDRSAPLLSRGLAVETLVRILAARDEDTASQAAKATGLLSDPTLGPRLRVDLAIVLVRHRQQRETALRRLVAMLKDPDSGVRRYTIRAMSGHLASVQESWKQAAVRLLLPDLQDVDRGVRAAAARAAWIVESEGQPPVFARRKGVDQRTINRILPVLTDAIQFEDPELGRQSLELIKDMDEYARGCAPALVQILAESSLPEKELSEICFLLIRIGARSKQAIPVLTRIVGDTSRNEELRWNAIRVLAETIGRARRSRQSASGTATYVPRQMPLSAVERAAVEVLIKSLKSKSVGDAAARALGRIGPHARAAVPALVEVVKVSEDQWQRTAAEWALKQIAP